MRFYTVFILSICTFFSYAQHGSEYLTKGEMENDLSILEEILHQQSSYQGLNGYDYFVDFEDYTNTLADKNITQFDFGLFLAKSIGKIGDRHAFIKDYNIRDSLFLPVAFAPLKDKTLVLNYDEGKKEYGLWNAEFPYLHSINDIPIEEILPQILVGAVLAPENAYRTNAIRKLRDIETIFRILDLELPNPLTITLENENEEQKKVTLNLVERKEKGKLWDEKSHSETFRAKEEQYGDSEFVKGFFKLKDDIGYIQIERMLAKKRTPKFFEELNDFMVKAKNNEALIIDVRNNGGGTRDLIQELAGYFIHPDSIYVVNATKQRGELPLNENLKRALHGRYLYSRDELDVREQKRSISLWIHLNRCMI